MQHFAVQCLRILCIDMGRIGVSPFSWLFILYLNKGELTFKKKQKTDRAHLPPSVNRQTCFKNCFYELRRRRRKKKNGNIKKCLKVNRKKQQSTNTVMSVRNNNFRSII